jgi:hypothetical protein
VDVHGEGVGKRGDSRSTRNSVKDAIKQMKNCRTQRLGQLQPAYSSILAK